MKSVFTRNTVRFLIAIAVVAGLFASFATIRRAVARTTPERIDSGRKIFLASCSMCHGTEGNGDGPLSSELMKEAGIPPAKLNDAARLSALGRAGVRKTIVEGGGHRNRSNLMPAWGDKLSPQAADDVTDFVMALPGLNPAVPAATLDKYLKAPKGSPEEGKRLYVYYCSGCHGLSGHGDGVYAKTLRTRDKVWPRNLTETGYLARKTDQDLYVVVSLGGGHVGKSAMMPAWTATLTPEQIKHLISYVRAISKTQSRP